MFKNKKLLFGCFSPPVMLATFVIEIILLVAVLVTRKLNKTAQLICISLFALAFFQLCEYFVCGGLGVNAAMWSRLGFISITTLPPLGLHLIYSIVNKKNRPLIGISYALMALWIIVFGFSENAFTSHQCVSNYVIFELTLPITIAYTIYYYGILLLGLGIAFRFSRIVKKLNIRQALYGMMLGYLVFLLPTAVVNTIDSQTMAGIPSIMCGFAALFALILFGYVLPRTSKRIK